MANQEKKYSFVSSTRIGDAVGQIKGKEVFSANATVQAFLTQEPEVRVLQDGRKVLKLSLALNNTGKKLTGALGLEKADETLWLNATLFDSEKVPTATRAEKVLKKGMLVLLNGIVKPEEYNGKTYFNMAVNDFKISWSAEKGKTVGGDYSFVSARKANKDGNAIVGFEGFLSSEPETKVTTGGKELLSFRVALNKATNKLNYPLGIQSAAENVTFITVNVWDNENGFSLKERAQKILKKGVAIIGHGLMTAKEGEKGYFYNVNLNDFEIVRGLGEKNAQPSPVEAIEPDDIPLDEDVPF